MSIAKQIFVRYRAQGHVRFAIPQELCQAETAQQLNMLLKQAEGIYRVDLFARQGKLSIRYIEGVTHFKTVSRAVFDALAKIQTPSACCGGTITKSGELQDDSGWLKTKFQETRETIQALGIVSSSLGKAKPFILTPENEKFAIEFLTDLLVLYLIKLHWHAIMSHWIKNPWQYRSEWMATIYMVFLLVRSKKPKP